MASEQEQNQTGALAALLSLFPYRIEGKWYLNQMLTFDGFIFVSCRFDNCTLFTSKGTFTIEKCYFSNCRVYYLDEAKKIVQLYNAFAPEGRKEAMEKWPGLAPTFNADGTVTIAT